MARLAHRHDIAEGVRATSGKPMDLPFAPQHCVTPANMVGATAHSAFAPTTSPVMYIITECHFVFTSDPLRIHARYHGCIEQSYKLV